MNNFTVKIFRSRNFIKFDGAAGNTKVIKRNYPLGVPGSGAGKGGGAGGSIKEAGGGLGKLGVANEEGYFHGKQREQLRNLKSKLELKKKLENAQKKEDE